MKKKYLAPAMSIEVFEANEYVAACYKIYCNVPGSGILWNENGKQEGLQTKGPNKDDQLTFRYLSACNRWHKGIIKSEPPKANGYWQNKGGQSTPVFWWRENLGSSSDYHATTLDKINWETNPNAS